MNSSTSRLDYTLLFLQGAEGPGLAKLLNLRKNGLTRFSKEEKKRLKRRTKERLKIASAKANLWRKFRDRNKELDMTEEEAEAWAGLRASVMELEEGGCWRETGE